MKDIENNKKESPFLGLTGLGGGVNSFAFTGLATELYNLWVWGNNTAGEFGVNERDDFFRSSSPVQVASGENDWKLIAPGGRSELYGTAAIKTDGTMWVWGGNDNSVLGLNDQTKYSSPVQIPGTWSNIVKASNGFLATQENGTLWYWGKNTYGMAGKNKAPANQWGYSSPTQIGTSTDWSTEIGQLGGGQEANWAIKTNGTMWAWGGNNGELGQDDTTKRSSPTQMGTDTNWAQIGGSAGGNFMAIKTNGTLWSCGEFGQGQLGQNTNSSYSSPRQVGTDTTWNFCTGGTTSFATKTDGSLWSWGYGEHSGGVSGLGDEDSRSSPTQIPGTWSTDYYTVTTADTQAGAIDSSGRLWTWGQNEVGQLGLNSRQNRSEPGQVGTDTDWKRLWNLSYGKSFAAFRKG